MRDQRRCFVRRNSGRFSFDCYFYIYIYIYEDWLITACLQYGKGTLDDNFVPYLWETLIRKRSGWPNYQQHWLITESQISCWFHQSMSTWHDTLMALTLLCKWKTAWQNQTRASGSHGADQVSNLITFGSLNQVHCLNIYMKMHADCVAPF
jgi:hypothetical protein